MRVLADNALHRNSFPILVTSGDLTATGSDSEFALAMTFLRSQLHVDRGPPLGLGGLFDEQSVHAVPGNHDHWAGRFGSALGAGTNTAIYRTWFGSHCWHVPYEKGGLVLQLMGIDTCGDGPRLAADGQVDASHLDTLQGRIDDARQIWPQQHYRHVNVLVMHHPARSYKAHHSLDQKSIDHIEDFCRSNRVAAILSGHTHRSEAPQSGDVAKQVLRLECGTTMQSSTVGHTRRSGQVFLAHVLEADGPNHVKWTCTRFVRVRGVHQFKDSQTKRVYRIDLT